ncbi:hypothetical protein [Micromonospora sp. NPDC005173]|uniref:hypothetical protein n=1 Tax=Micromonospora sp. NPDC005173 TaxID=3157165 RepID=UPI0033BCA704
MPDTLGTLHEVVRDVIADFAPAELPVVKGLGLLDERTVSRQFRNLGPKREPLGFGLGEIALLATPVVWVVLEQAAKGATDSLAERSSEWVRSRLKRRPVKTSIPDFTSEQQKTIYQAALSEAKKRGLPEDEAVAIADAIHRRLTMDRPDDLPGSA